jgi:hypothetical protein
MEFSLHLPLSLKMQGNEVEAVKTPTVRSWEIYLLLSIFSKKTTIVTLVLGAVVAWLCNSENLTLLIWATITWSFSRREIDQFVTLLLYNKHWDVCPIFT